MNGFMRRGTLAATAAIAAAMALAAPASAGVLTMSATECGDETLTQPFAPWKDRASYKINPGGTFEAANAAWTLRGGAQIGAGNEPWKVGGASHGRSLRLPAGSTAISATSCVA